MTPTTLNNIALSKKVEIMINNNPKALGFILGVVGDPAINKDLMGAPMIGDLTLYEAIELAYINDKIEFCEITSACADSEDGLRVTERTENITGELMISALKNEIFVRENLRAYAPAFASGFGGLMAENIETLKKAGLVSGSMAACDCVEAIDSLMMAALQSEIVATMCLSYDEGRELATGELSF